MSLKAQDTNIEVLREPQNFQEPTYGWDGKTGMFETLSIRQHFNAVSPALAPDARDIFAMSNKTSWERPPSLEYHNNGTATSVNSPTVPEILGSYALSGLEAGFDPTAFLCGYCQPGGKIQTNRLHSAIFNDILQSTKSPALALQTFATTLWGLSYYNSLFQFDTYGPAEVVNQVPVIKPTGRSFFYAVIGLLALHVILIVFITTLYIVVARNSLIGNAWSASAQLRGDETREWIEKASYMTDKEVKKAIEADGKGLVTIGVGKMDVRLRQRYSEAQ
jgi:hypothetical protein